MFLLTAKDFQTEQIAKDIITTMNKYPRFSPTLYDSTEPLKKSFDISRMDELIDLWMNSEVNKLWVEKEYASGSFIAKRKSKLKTDFFASWTKNQQAQFNLCSVTVELKELTTDNFWEEFMELCFAFINIVEPVYGNISILIPNKSEPINLNIRLPELKWITILGQPYIELFGKEKLLSTPCYKVHEYSHSIIGLQMVNSVYDEIPSELKKAVKMHLGEEAFVEEGKGIKRHKTGLTPIFDYSGVLFNPQKPIEVQEIYKRDR